MLECRGGGLLQQIGEFTSTDIFMLGRSYSTVSILNLSNTSETQPSPTFNPTEFNIQKNI